MDFDFTTETITPTTSTVLTVNDTGALQIAVGTTAQRPTGNTGMIRFNTSNTALEYYNGSVWVTNTSAVAGTANQINSSASGETSTLSLSNTIITPGTINTGTGLYQSVTSAVAAAGTTFSTATQLTTIYNSITSGTNGTAGVMLPVPSQAGQAIYVFNRDTTGQQTLLVYPNTGGQIGNTAANTPATIAYGFGTVYISASTTQWYTLAPSITGGTGISVSPQLGNTAISTVLGSTQIGYGNVNGNMVGTSNLTFNNTNSAVYIGTGTDTRAAGGFGTTGYLQISGTSGINLGAAFQNTNTTGYTILALTNDQTYTTVQSQLTLNGSAVAGTGMSLRPNELSLGQLLPAGDTSIYVGSTASTIRFGVRSAAPATEYLRMTGTATATTSGLVIPQFTTAGILRNNATGQIISTSGVLPSTVTAQTANITTAGESIVQSLNIPVGNMAVGTTFKIKSWGYYQANATNTVTFTMRMGTAGTTADASFVTTLAVTSTATGFGGFTFEGIVTILSTGTTGTGWGHYSLQSNGTTGISTISNAVQTNNTNTTINTTVANILTLGIKNSASAGTLSVFGGYIEQVN